MSAPDEPPEVGLEKELRAQTGELDDVAGQLENGEERPVCLAAVNRLGRSITCEVTVTRLGRQGNGAVVTMEELQPT